MINNYNGENSVVIRHEQEERRRDMLDAEAEARGRLALEDDGPIPPKTVAHMEAVRRIKENHK